MNDAEYFNGQKISQLTGQTKFEYDKLVKMEADMAPGLSLKNVFTESMFVRQGLPILTGMLDDTFSHEAWEQFAGSQMVAVQIVADDDHSRLLFEIPSLLNTGRSLLYVEGQPTLTEETDEIRLHAEIISEVGERAMAEMIGTTLDNIDMLSFKENSIHAKYVIDLLNWIFSRYKINGRLPYPEGLLDVVGKANPKANQVTNQQQENKEVEAFGDDY